MPKTRVKTPVKQRPRDSELRRCGECGHGVGADDKFCTGCGKPLAGVAPAAVPQRQKQRPKTKTKPAAPRKKARTPQAAPSRLRKPTTVPILVPKKQEPQVAPAVAPPKQKPKQRQEQKPVVAPPLWKRKDYLDNLPDKFYCSSICKVRGPDGPKCPNCGLVWVCKTPVSHGALNCPKCNVRFKKCIHLDGKKYDPKKCAAYHEWAVRTKNRSVFDVMFDQLNQM